jgi:hypothetical protein
MSRGPLGLSRSVVDFSSLFSCGAPDSLPTSDSLFRDALIGNLRRTSGPVAHMRLYVHTLPFFGAPHNIHRAKGLNKLAGIYIHTSG